MIKKTFIVDMDGVITVEMDVSDEYARDLIRFGTVVALFRQTVGGIRYADIDQFTHEIEWKFAEQKEE